MARTKKPRFPLWRHSTGQWAKRIGGRFYYFGRDHDLALKEYLRVKDDLEAGRRPREKTDTATIADAVNHFLSEKKNRVDSGELAMKTWCGYHAVCECVVDQFGRNRAVSDLAPTDFAELRSKLAARLGPVSLGSYIVQTRVLFTHAVKFGVISAPPRYGAAFDRPTKKVLRLARIERGVRLIGPADLRRMIAAADPQLKAMTLLGINGGLGATDVATLTRTAVAAEPGWLSLHRRKTGVARRCPLWVETQEALQDALAVRREPKDPAHADLLFLTRCRHPWVRFVAEDGKQSVHDAVGLQFHKLAKRLGIKLVGRFNVLRHTFRTIADEVGDRPAIDLVMGHQDPTMAAHYRERVSDERLQAVVAHVRRWLFGKGV